MNEGTMKNANETNNLLADLTYHHQNTQLEC